MGTGYSLNIATGETTEYEAAAPAPYVPQSVTRRQARLALLEVGELANVEGALNSLPSPQKEAALIEWQDALTFDYDHPLIEQIAAALELDKDALFALAATK